MFANRSHRSVFLALVVAAAGLFMLAAPAMARAESYAAIAYSDSTGRYGYSYGFGSRPGAEYEALAQCGTPDARILVWSRNAFVALAVSDNGAVASAWGSTEAVARRIALQQCRDNGGFNVRIAVSVYSGD